MHLENTDMARTWLVTVKEVHEASYSGDVARWVRATQNEAMWRGEVLDVVKSDGHALGTAVLVAIRREYWDVVKTNNIIHSRPAHPEVMLMISLLFEIGVPPQPNLLNIVDNTLRLDCDELNKRFYWACKLRYKLIDTKSSSRRICMDVVVRANRFQPTSTLRAAGRVWLYACLLREAMQWSTDYVPIGLADECERIRVESLDPTEFYEAFFAYLSELSIENSGIENAALLTQGVLIAEVYGEYYDIVHRCVMVWGRDLLRRDAYEVFDKMKTRRDCCSLLSFDRFGF